LCVLVTAIILVLARGLGVFGEDAAATADNERCFVCHFDHRTEPFAVRHARAGVSCEKCHGPSDMHCGDEEHLTPPDVMYPPGKVVPACMVCHEAPGRLAKAETACPRYHEDPETRAQVCTDCHGMHRLTKRRTTWDKKTGEVLPDK
jgi:hypothetical protein